MKPTPLPTERRPPGRPKLPDHLKSRRTVKCTPAITPEDAAAITAYGNGKIGRGATRALELVAQMIREGKVTA